MNLYGWDTAYAVNVSVLNTALKGATTLPKTFSLADGGLKASGTFGNWSVVSGGSGILLHIQAEIASGTVSGGTDPQADLAGMSLIFEIDLSLLPASANVQELRLNLKTAGKVKGKGGDGVVLPYSIAPTGKLGFEQALFMQNAMAQFLVAQADKFTFAFARINMVPPNAADSWLAPVKIAFSYYPSGSAGDFLVIYAATTNRDVSGLSTQVDPALLAGPGPAYFAISAGMFMEHVILPLMPKVYPGFDGSYFKFDAAKSTVVNTKAMTLKGVKSGAITYYPVVRSLSVGVSASKIVSVVSGDCDLKMGMSMTYGVTSNSQTSFDASKDQLSAAKDPSPQAHHESHIPWYDYLLGPLPDMIMAIVVPLVADGIASGINSALSGMQIANAGPQTVNWPGMQKFTPNGGGLNGGFQLSGS